MTSGNTGNRRSDPERRSFLQLGFALVLGAIWVAGLMIWSSRGTRDLTTLELTLFQVMTLLLGLAGSYVFGRQSASRAAEDIVKPHARSSFRRVVSLYRALQRFGAAIDSRREFLLAVSTKEGDDRVSMDHVHAALDLLQAQVLEQIGTADDAMEDWRDIVPTDVAQIEADHRHRLEEDQSQ